MKQYLVVEKEMDGPTSVKRETKSKRVNLLMKPSVYGKLERHAAERGVSVNSLVDVAVEEFIMSRGI